MAQPNPRPLGQAMRNDSTNYRRVLLKAVAGAAAGMFMPSVLAQSPHHHERKLLFYNTHTGESLKTTYWLEGQYLGNALDEINHVLRDHRSNEVHPIDPGLLDLLHSLQTKVKSRQQFEVISGYRSPATNAVLHKKSNGVAKRSLHMQGKAIDVRLTGCDLEHLRQAALSLRAGGVGYYAQSDFIHVDTGRVRFW